MKDSGLIEVSNNEDQIIIRTEESSLEDDSFDMDSFFEEARYSLSMTSLESTTYDDPKSLSKSYTNDIPLKKGERCQNRNEITGSFQEFAVHYVQRYLVTDLLRGKRIKDWEQSTSIREMTALPTAVRECLNVKNLKLGPLLRLITINSIKERIDQYRENSLKCLNAEDKDDIIQSLLIEEFRDDDIWEKLVPRFLEAGFVSDYQMSCFHPNKASFSQKMEVLKETNCMDYFNHREHSFMCPKLVFNLSKLQEKRTISEGLPYRRPRVEDFFIFDPMVKQKMTARLREYYNDENNTLPKFTKTDFEQNINAGHPILNHLSRVRAPGALSHAGENNSCLLFDINQKTSMERQWLEKKKLAKSLGVKKESRYPHFDGPESHYRFRYHSSITGGYYLGYQQMLFRQDSYRKWVFETVHFNRISSYMYSLERAAAKKCKEENDWPCMIYDLSILNLPFTADGADFITTWLLAPKDETEKGFVYLPGLKEQYQAIVVEKISQADYIQSQHLQHYLHCEESQDCIYKISLSFD